MEQDIRIVVLQRGWVALGEYSRAGEHAKLTKACVVRRWGTTKGLGQLAAEGPQPQTILDRTPDIEFHTLAELLTFRCNPEKWAAHFGG